MLQEYGTSKDRVLAGDVWIFSFSFSFPFPPSLLILPLLLRFLLSFVFVFVFDFVFVLRFSSSPRDLLLCLVLSVGLYQRSLQRCLCLFAPLGSNVTFDDRTEKQFKLHSAITLCYDSQDYGF